MALDEVFLKELLAIFDIELVEQIQLMTGHLIDLEQGNDEEVQTLLIETLRAAHTIKGAATGVGQKDIVEVVHRIESILSGLSEGFIQQTDSVLDLLLEALGRIQDIFYSQRNGQEYLFDFNQLIIDLDWYLKGIDTKPFDIDVIEQPIPQNISDAKGSIKNNALIQGRENTHIETYTVTVKDVSDLSGIIEELQTTKIQFKQMLNDYHLLAITLTNLSSGFNEISGVHFDSEKSNIVDLVAGLSQFSNQVTNLYNVERAFGSKFNRLVNNLDQSVNSLRLVSFATLIAPLERIVRELSQEQNKKINFIVVGNEIKIDRHLYKNIHIPLVHLITNAIDHGIESIDIRREKGKNIKATLKLVISKKANELCIELEDDGQGINLDAIKKKVLKQSLVSESDLKTLDDKQIVDFIFKIGFSSKTIVTTTSGRGVGLDVVRNTLRKVKGTVDVSSKHGVSTKFTLKFPATLSSEQGLLISINQQVFAIPAYGVEWVKYTDRKLLKTINNQLLLGDKNNHPVSVYYLSKLLGLSNKNNANSNVLATVYISDGSQRIVLLVDEIIGDQELIIKPFSYPLLKVPFSIGVTSVVMGHLIPVLSVDELIEKSNGLISNVDLSVQERQQPLQKNVLIVDDSVTTRTLVSNILVNQGFCVTTLINGLQAWEELVKNNNYDLVITDIEMPLLNGFELVEKIKSNENTSQIPIIIVTSLNSEQEKKRGLQVGADAYISKDRLDTDTLLVIIKQLV